MWTHRLRPDQPPPVAPPPVPFAVGRLPSPLADLRLVPPRTNWVLTLRIDESKVHDRCMHPASFGIVSFVQDTTQHLGMSPVAPQPMPNRMNNTVGQRKAEASTDLALLCHLSRTN